LRKRRAVGAAVGLLLDRALGEPPAGVHPIAAFGAAMVRLEERLYRDDRLAGVAYAGVAAGLGAAAGSVLRSTAAATLLAVAGRQLGEEATGVGAALLRGDLDTARARLPALVGRDVSAMDEKDVARAVVESVAENTVDAVVAPALWATFAGAPGALVYRALNTVDAMVGHRSARYERFGWASARADDVAAWLPARATGLLVAAVRPRHAPEIVRVVRRDAGAHPSPNAGVAEAAFAAALGLRLGGENRYGDRVELRPALGDGRPAEAMDIARAIRLSRDVTYALAAALTIGAIA
jgi:adenosylcobinamide-phosphate synthase